MNEGRDGGVDGCDNRGASNRDQKFTGVALRLTLMFVVVAITCLLINQSTDRLELFRNYNSSFSRPKDSNTSSLFHQYTSRNPPFPAKEEKIELEKTLRKAAMKDKRTVIITTLNAAWTEPDSIFDLFLESFRIGNGTAHLLDHVVVGAVDQTAYERCEAERLHCYTVKTEGVNFSGEVHYMSEDYLKMMWRRTDFLRTVLELGYNFVFTDADIMWLRDPFERFYPDGEFQIASDFYGGNYTDLNNAPNCGFQYVKSSNRTIQFYKYWYNGHEYFPGANEQDVLNMVKYFPFMPRIGLEIRFLDTAYFGGFCESGKDLDRIITMHANCCVGLENKIHDLKMVIDDWKRYLTFTAHHTNLTTKSWTVPRICGGG